jgi:replicative DNA helicase
MESNSIYQESYNELKSIKKSLGSNSLKINFDKLDTETAGAIRSALSNAISTRSSTIISVIGNNN